jgi:WxcM-like, C-terminal
MKLSTVYDCSIVEMKKIQNRAGNITIVESNTSIPFAIKRVYYLYDVPAEEERGGHTITLKDGKTNRSFHLNNPNLGLLVVPGIWRELNNFSSGSVCLVLASMAYSEEDYIRLYDDFIKYKL